MDGVGLQLGKNLSSSLNLKMSKARAWTGAHRQRPILPHWVAHHTCHRTLSHPTSGPASPRACWGAPHHSRRPFRAGTGLARHGTRLGTVAFASIAEGACLFRLAVGSAPRGASNVRLSAVATWPRSTNAAKRSGYARRARRCRSRSPCTSTLRCRRWKSGPPAVPAPALCSRTAGRGRPWAVARACWHRHPAPADVWCSNT